MKKPFVNISLVVCLLTLIFLSCSQEETITYQLNSKLVQLKNENTFALKITPALEGLHYTSLNTNIATVSNEGLIKANLVGTTKILVNDSLNRFVDTVTVVVSTLYTSFKDPYLVFGGSKDDIFWATDLNLYKSQCLESDNYFDLYFYDPLATNWIYYDYYLSKDNKLLFTEVTQEDCGELDWHIASRYSPIKSFTFSTTSISSDTVTYTTGYAVSFFTNPDSSLIVINEKSSRSSYGYVYYFPANKENIQRILDTDKDNGKQIFYWFIYSVLYPDMDLSDLLFSPKKRPNVSTPFTSPIRRPEKQIHSTLP